MILTMSNAYYRMFCACTYTNLLPCAKSYLILSKALTRFMPGQGKNASISLLDLILFFFLFVLYVDVPFQLQQCEAMFVSLVGSVWLTLVRKAQRVRERKKTQKFSRKKKVIHHTEQKERNSISLRPNA